MTEPYAVLAGFYDRLMEDTDYGAWVSFYLRCFEKFGIRPEKILISPVAQEISRFRSPHTAMT